MDGEGSEMKDLMKKLSELENERDYYRQVAERLGQKALADAQDFSKMIRDLRQREINLHQIQEKLEQTITERTAELVTRNKEFGESNLPAMIAWSSGFRMACIPCASGIVVRCSSNT